MQGRIEDAKFVYDSKNVSFREEILIPLVGWLVGFYYFSSLPQQYKVQISRGTNEKRI